MYKTTIGILLMLGVIGFSAYGLYKNEISVEDALTAVGFSALLFYLFGD
ncbi:TMhelix containing protein [Vibrio phage 1.055.O._10N.286.55.E9]|nr:TMhelix containing protein [Vibrio phage 1.055.O._10N.286.55.E9]